MTRSIAIIGAGPGGLASAMLLARAGAKVTVFERAGDVGGRSAAITAPGGFRFDMGPTFFLYPRVLDDIFAACGLDLSRAVDLIRLDPQYELIFEAGGRIQATADLKRMQEQVARLAPADAAALPRFMAENREKLARFKPILEMPFNSWRDLVRPDMLRALPMMRPFRTVDTDLAQCFSDERVRLAFSFQSKYLGMSPFKCPSLFTILAFMEYEYGVFHPRGGCGAVMQAMGEAATDLGAEIRLRAPVHEILFDRRRAVGVRSDLGEERFDAVLVNADFAHSMRNLVPDSKRRRWTNRRIDGKKFSCSTFMLYLGIEGIYEDLSHHSIYLSEDYRRNVAEIDAGEAPEIPSLYVQNACVTDKSLAPPGHSTLYVLVPVGNRHGAGLDWPALQTEYRAKTIARLEKLGIRDLESRIRTEKILTPAGWETDMAIHRGATFNLAHSLDQMLCFRPHNRFEDLDRVYLVGGGTHPGSGLPVIFESARITCKLLAEDLGLPGHWQAGTRMADMVDEPVLETTP
jgi:phytoene desaturase